MQGSPTEGAPNASKEAERLEAIKKFLLALEEFVAELTKFVQGLVQPLQKSAALSRDEFDTIFSNIEALKEVNVRLVSALKAAENSDQLEMVGSVLVANVCILLSFCCPVQTSHCLFAPGVTFQRLYSLLCELPSRNCVEQICDGAWLPHFAGAGLFCPPLLP